MAGLVARAPGSTLGAPVFEDAVPVAVLGSLLDSLGHLLCDLPETQCFPAIPALSKSGSEEQVRFNDVPAPAQHHEAVSHPVAVPVVVHGRAAEGRRRERLQSSRHHAVRDQRLSRRDGGPGESLRLEGLEPWTLVGEILTTDPSGHFVVLMSVGVDEGDRMWAGLDLDQPFQR